MNPVDNDCPKYEKEVNENPEGQGSQALRHLKRKKNFLHFLHCIEGEGPAGFTSGEEDMVETRIPVSERKRVTRRLTRPGTTCGVAIGKYWGWVDERGGGDKWNNEKIRQKLNSDLW